MLSSGKICNISIFSADLGEQKSSVPAGDRPIRVAALEQQAGRLQCPQHAVHLTMPQFSVFYTPITWGWKPLISVELTWCFAAETPRKLCTSAACSFASGSSIKELLISRSYACPWRRWARAVLSFIPFPIFMELCWHILIGFHAVTHPSVSGEAWPSL